MFGATVAQDVEVLGPAITVVQEETYRRQFVLFDLPEWVPLPQLRRARQAFRTIERVVTRIVEERRRTDAPEHNDLLAMLLNAKDADTGEPMDDTQLRDEVRTVFLAGHETTANALTWTWYLLACNPDSAKKLRSELARVLGGRVPTVDDLPQLAYTKMVIEESMRLLPPAWTMSREAIADDEIDGYRIPSGSTVVLSQFITQRHPDFWEDPEKFEPERFTPERVHQRHRFAYFPFGGGPRFCIGSNFAMLEAQLVLATIAQRYELDLVRDHPVQPEPLITLRPKYGLVMTLRPCAPPLHKGDSASVLPTA
jgi:cytochrome P450